MTTPPIRTLIDKLKPDNAVRKVLAFDPGETTGWALMHGSDLIACGQINTKTIEREGSLELAKLMTEYRPDLIVYESYKVYSWKADQHKWSEIQTLQVIGLIRWFAYSEKIPVTKQTAQLAKQFCTDKKLADWNLWLKGQKHARDAIRHAVYVQLFTDDIEFSG